MSIKNLLFSSQDFPVLRDFGILLFRAFAGLSMLTHGYPKLMKIINGDISFPDPIGMGTALSLYCITFAEFFCAILLVVGLFSRLSTLPLIFGMFVAGIIFHGPDPYATKELALVYMAAYSILLVTGPGRFSLDHLITRNKDSKA